MSEDGKEYVKREVDYFREEVWQMVRRRYGNMTVYETIAALELIKFELISSLPTKNQ